jgi:hypothetical protein
MWECPECKSRFFSEPVTLGVRNGQLTRIPPICTNCFKSCSCGQRQPYGEYCRVCGDPRKKVNLIRYEIDPDDPTFGLTSTGSTTYLETYVGGTGDVSGENQDYELASKITVSTAGTIIKIRLKTSGTGNVKLAFFDDDGASGEPSTRLIDWGAFACANGVNTFTVSGYYAPAGDYYIAVLFDSAILRYASTGGTMRYKARTYANGIESPWPNATDGHNPESLYLQAGFVYIENYVKATKATLAENAASVTSMSFYSHATGNFYAGIYTDSSGPAVLKWTSPSTAASATAWTTVLISAGTPNTLALAAGDYWLAWQWDSVNAGPSYTLGGANTGAYLAQAYGAFPDPMTGETLSTENWSLYVTYVQYAVTGIVRDGTTGDPIEGATVWLFKTSDKSYIGTDTSDVNGAYSIVVPDGVTAYFVRAFKDGSNVFGTTDDDLVGA